MIMRRSIGSRSLLWIFALLLLSASALDDEDTRRRPGGGRPGGGRPGGGRPGGSTGGGSTGGGTTGQLHTYPPSSGWSGTTYRPPQQITHGSTSFPVSQTPPSPIIYQMRDSGSRYSNLVTGLMLWNAGRLSSSSHTNTVYRGQPGEVCRFRLVTNDTIEERRIQCEGISSFIWEWENSNGTNSNDTVIENIGSDSNSTEVMDALEDKGEMILVTTDMRCYIVRTVASSSWSRQVDCALLQTYTANSWRNGAERLAPALVIVVLQVILFKIL